jgi:hypothetical protein
MEKLTKYRETLQQIVRRHAQFQPSHGKITPLMVCDTVNDQYLLLDAGWDKTGRVHSVAFHAQIRDGKIHIEWDGTEYGIAQELVDAGVPKEDIVLAFYRPEMRPLTEYAAA